MSETTKNKVDIKQVIPISAIQMASGPNVAANLYEAERLISMSVTSGARLVVLPENFSFMGLKEVDKLNIRESFGKGKVQQFLSEQAKKHKIWIVGGTVPLEATDEHKVRAACLLYNSARFLFCSCISIDN